MRILGATLFAVLVAGCGVKFHHEATFGLPESCRENLTICSDGRPVLILQSLQCAGGICGYTCDPKRWEKP